MQKMMVQDEHGNTLFIGTKNDCMHFIKVRRLNREEVSIAPHQEITQTVPKTLSEAPPKTSWFKRVFTK